MLPIEPAPSAAPVASSSPPPVIAIAEPAPAPVGCRGDAFDLDAVPSGCKGEGDSNPGAFTAALVPTPAKLPGDSDLTVALELVNTSKHDAALVFTPSCARFELGAYRNGKRADFINEGCGFGGGCGGPPRRVVVSPGGKLVKRLELRTVVRRLDKLTCTESLSGPLPPGRYELRVESIAFFPVDVKKARASFDVIP